MVNLGICSGICNTLINSSHRACVPSETEGVNAKVFNMIITETTNCMFLSCHVRVSE